MFLKKIPNRFSLKQKNILIFVFTTSDSFCYHGNLKKKNEKNQGNSEKFTSLIKYTKGFPIFAECFYGLIDLIIVKI